MSRVLFPGSHGCQLLGGKAHALAALNAANLAIPPWFVITPDAFKASLIEQQVNDLSVAENPDQFKQH